MPTLNCQLSVQLTYVQILADDLCPPTKGLHGKPLRVFLQFAALVLPSFRGRDGKLSVAVPCWPYFSSRSRPRFPINITFCIMLLLLLLLFSSFYPSLAWPLRATACTFAGHAPVAGSAPHHQRTADVAGRRISELHKFTDRFNLSFPIRGRHGMNGHWTGLEQFSLLILQKLELHPTEEIIHQ